MTPILSIRQLTKTYASGLWALKGIYYLVSLRNLGRSFRGWRARARNIRDALAEDIGRGDWTAMLVPATQSTGTRMASSLSSRPKGTPAG